MITEKMVLAAERVLPRVSREYIREALRAAEGARTEPRHAPEHLSLEALREDLASHRGWELTDTQAAAIARWAQLRIRYAAPASIAWDEEIAARLVRKYSDWRRVVDSSDAMLNALKDVLGPQRLQLVPDTESEYIPEAVAGLEAIDLPRLLDLVDGLLVVAKAMGAFGIEAVLRTLRGRHGKR